jgi:hypothetical protein
MRRTCASDAGEIFEKRQNFDCKCLENTHEVMPGNDRHPQQEREYISGTNEGKCAANVVTKW